MPLHIGAVMIQDLDSAGIELRRQDVGNKRLVDQVREAIRTRNYSRRTGKTYWYWIRYFIFFHGKRHPAEMGAAEVSAFLSWLATERDVAAATQNQALHAGLLYGAGLRQIECLTLRIKDIEFAYRQIIVRDGKGAKDRATWTRTRRSTSMSVAGFAR